MCLSCCLFFPPILYVGPLNGSGIVDELKGQQAVLKDCIEQLTSIESSRANLVTYLREALQEQVDYLVTNMGLEICVIADCIILNCAN